MCIISTIRTKTFSSDNWASQGENKMTDQLTVAQLIAILQAIPNQDALVEMAMNQEYQNAVDAYDIHDYGDLVIIGE
jgi:hypothetical protein